MDEAKLPPLDETAFDGKRFEAPIPKTESLPKKCDHKGKVTILSSTELKCQCGIGYSGQNVITLYNLFMGWSEQTPS